MATRFGENLGPTTLLALAGSLFIIGAERLRLAISNPHQGPPWLIHKAKFATSLGANYFLG
jgi:hypothetical protein